MKQFENAPEATAHFGDVNPKHEEALSAIQNAVTAMDNIRHEALRSIISYPIELGYSGAPS